MHDGWQPVLGGWWSCGPHSASLPPPPPQAFNYVFNIPAFNKYGVKAASEPCGYLCGGGDKSKGSDSMGAQQDTVNGEDAGIQHVTDEVELS